MRNPVRLSTAAVCAALALLLFPGSAMASEPPSTSVRVAVSWTVRPGDTAWAVAERLCGDGSMHSRLLIASPAGATRVNHDRIWPGDRVSGSCLGAGSGAPRPSGSSVRASASGWVSPLAHYELTSCYGPRWGTFHYGIDMSAPAGATIRAIGSGLVTRTGWVWGGYGISTVISHGGGVWSHVAHQSASLVRVGQRVSAGQAIGRVGSTGDATGPHVHLEIARSAGVLGSQVNPAAWLRGHGVRVGC